MQFWKLQRPPKQLTEFLQFLYTQRPVLQSSQSSFHSIFSSPTAPANWGSKKTKKKNMEKTAFLILCLAFDQVQELRHGSLVCPEFEMVHRCPVDGKSNGAVHAIEVSWRHAAFVDCTSRRLVQSRTYRANRTKIQKAKRQLDEPPNNPQSNT